MRTSTSTPIAPGALNTRLLDEVLAAGPAKAGEQFHARAVKQQQDGGTAPDKGAELAVFLASAASDGISGRLLSAVWDDWRTLPERREQLAASDVYTLQTDRPGGSGTAMRSGGNFAAGGWSRYNLLTGQPLPIRARPGAHAALARAESREAQRQSCSSES